MYKIKFGDGTEKEFESLAGADLRDADLYHADLRYANLKDADLSGAYLKGADLTNANLDYSVLPLSCGGLNMKIDAKIARQLVYHAFAQECDDPEYLELRKLCADFANKFHRVESEDCEKIGD